MITESSFEQSLVAILDGNEEIWGTGFLVFDRLVTTCVHIVRKAGGRPGAEVSIRFYGNSKVFTATVLADLWNEAEDVAFLQLPEETILKATPLPVGLIKRLEGVAVRCFGYPETGTQGLWAEGNVRGMILADKGRSLIQIDSGEITAGFSGAPVWDIKTGLVMGIVTAIAPTDRYGRMNRVAFATPIATLASIYPALPLRAILGNLHNVPPLPDHFLPRSNDLESLKIALLSANNIQNGILNKGKVGVQGMGGIGKSVLAAALAHDESIQQAFPDGVVWLTISQIPNLTARQSDLVYAATGQRESFADTSQGRIILRDLLADKTCLIILDDVWNVSDVAVFDILGQKSRMLITTRNGEVGRSLGFQNYEMTVLTESEALWLLAHWAGKEDGDLPSGASEVARECGYLPLALAMIGALVRHKPDAWTRVLRRLQKADLEKIQQQFPDYPYPSLFRAIQVSVEVLPTAPLNVQERFFDLAVFPEDAPIPETALRVFWRPLGLDSDDVAEIVEKLVHRSLVRRDFEGRLLLHDLHADYVRSQTPDLPHLHSSLVQAYKSLCSNGWASGPNDGYFYQNLAYHLYKAQKTDELIFIVEDENWKQTKRMLDITGSDIGTDITWAVKSAVEGGLHTIPQFIKAAFALAKIRTQSSNLPSQVFETLANLGKLNEAIRLSELVIGDVAQVNSLWALGKWCIDHEKLDQAYGLLNQVKTRIPRLSEKNDKSFLLVRLASDFTSIGKTIECHQCLTDAFRCVESREKIYEKGLALATLVSGMQDYESELLFPSLEKALNVARQIQQAPTYRAFALIKIAEQLNRYERDDAKMLIMEAIPILVEAPPSYFGEGYPGFVNSFKDKFIAGSIKGIMLLGLDEKVEALISSIEDVSYKVIAFIELGKAYAERNDKEKALEIYNKAQAIIEEKLGGTDQESFRRHLVRQYLEIGCQSLAESLAKSIQDQNERVEAFILITDYLAQKGEYEKANQWSKELGLEWGRSFLRTAIGFGLLESDAEQAMKELHESIELASQIEEGIVGSQQSAYEYLARAISKLSIKHPDYARELVTKLIQDLQAKDGVHSLGIWNTERMRDSALNEIADHLIDRMDYPVASEVATQISNNYRKDIAVFDCIESAYLDDDTGVVEELSTRLTANSFKLMAEMLMKVYLLKSGDSFDKNDVDSFIETIKEQCKDFPNPNEVFGHMAISYWLLEQFEAARTFLEHISDKYFLHVIKIELIRRLVKLNRIEESQELIDELEYATFKAHAYAYLAQFYANKSIDQTKELIDHCWKILNPHNLPLEYWKNWAYDDAMILILEALALFDPKSAIEKITWIEKEEKQLQASGRIAGSLLATDLNLSCTRLIEIISNGAENGLHDFWSSIKACSKSLVGLIDPKILQYLFKQDWKNLIKIA